MNNPNPLIPQGSLLEQQARGKPYLRIALFIAAVHLVFLGGLLMQGCKPEDTTVAQRDDAEPSESPGFGKLDLNSIYPPSETSNVASPFDPGRTAEPPSFDPGVESPARTQIVDQPILQPFDEPVSPQPAPVLSPPPAVAREHKIEKGDSFYSIAPKYNVTADMIAKANPEVDPRRLRIGQVIKIPSPGAATSAPGETLAPGTGLYEVKSGDTLTRIAAAHGTTVAELQRLNGLTTARIITGQKLKVPVASTPGGTL